MKLTSRDWRALLILLLVAVAMGCRWAVVSSNPKPAIIAQVAPTGQLLTILAKRREAAGAVAQKQEILRRLRTQLAVEESGLIQAATAAQAQAHLLEILKNVTSQQKPPLEVKRIEFSAPQEVSDAFGEVSVSISIECRIDELLNLIAALTETSEIIATEEISLTVADQNLKILLARLTVKGLVRRSLILKPVNPQT